MPSNDLHKELAKLLAKLPVTETFDGRSILLDGIVSPDSLGRSESMRLLDLEKIVTSLALLQPDGKLLCDLIRNAHSYAPDAESKEQLEGLLSRVSARELPSPSNLDLDMLVNKFRATLYKNPAKQQGVVVGFGIPLDDEGFIQNLCERLIAERGRKQIENRGRLTLKSQLASIQETVNQLKRLGYVLQTKDVLYHVHIQLEDRSSAAQQLKDFWDKLCLEYQSQPKNHLIILMTGNQETPFPPSAILLPVPELDQDQLLVWIGEVVEAQGWPDSIIDEWTRRCLAYCSNEHGLNVCRLYGYLSDCHRLLQERPSWEDFLKELDRWSIPYA